MNQPKNPPMPASTSHVAPRIFAREMIETMGTLYAFHAVFNWSTKALDAGDIDDHRYYRAVALMVYRFSLTSVQPNEAIEQLLEAGRLQPSVHPTKDSDGRTEALRAPAGFTSPAC